jgi:hypothetical protein
MTCTISSASSKHFLVMLDIPCSVLKLFSLQIRNEYLHGTYSFSNCLKSHVHDHIFLDKFHALTVYICNFNLTNAFVQKLAC